MEKYNLSNIMKSAWNMYRKAQNWTNASAFPFSECLRRAWAEAKEAVKAAAKAIKTGLRRMHYGEYKRDYSDCQTVEGSYDKKTKTIEVLTLVRKSFKRIAYKAGNGLCPYCHTYCYGDCRAH